MEKISGIPDQAIIDFEAKSVIVTPEWAEAFPEIPEAFREADLDSRFHSLAQLQALEEGQFNFYSQAAGVNCSLIPGNSNEMLVIWSPFSDSAPNSSAKEIHDYMRGRSDSKLKARPNSWSQTTKSANTAAVLHALGHDMPVLTIYNVIPSSAYKPGEHLQLAKGDFTPAGRILSQAITEAQERLHGGGSETQIDTLHIQGSSIGASNAIGSAYANMRSGEREVVSVTTQELVAGPAGLPSLGHQFTIGGTVGEPSDLVEGRDYEKVGEIPEPYMRSRIDRAGNEPAMVGRMLLGMIKLGRNRGMTHPESNATLPQLEAIIDDGVSVLVPLGVNSGITRDTRLYVPDRHIVEVAATEGQHATHLIDEHVGVTTLMTVAHVTSTRQR